MSEHRVAGRCRASVMLGGALCAVACAPEVTSIGAWSPDRSLYLEAEDGELSGGFDVLADDHASNAAFLEAPAGAAETEPGPARARYPFSILAADAFTIWGRIRSPDADRNRFWFRIDDGAWLKWRISVGDVWYWDDFHDDTDYGTPLSFLLDAGEHELVLANCAGGAELDRLRVSPAGEAHPANDTACDPPHSIELGGLCLPSCGSQRGTMCGEVVCSGKTILDAYDCAVCCRDAP